MVRLNSTNIIKHARENIASLNPILFYGNEGGMISNTIKSIFDIAKLKTNLSNIKIFDYKTVVKAY